MCCYDNQNVRSMVRWGEDFLLMNIQVVSFTCRNIFSVIRQLKYLIVMWYSRLRVHVSNLSCRELNCSSLTQKSIYSLHFHYCVALDTILSCPLGMNLFLVNDVINKAKIYVLAKCYYLEFKDPITDHH